MTEKSGNESALKVFLLDLGLEKFLKSKLRLKEVLEIGSETCKKIKPSENVFLFYLQKLFALNTSARMFHSDETEKTDNSKEFNIDDFFEENDDESNALNPLDVLCALLHCSDMFLQQEVIRKMSLCQFAVPLILPAADGSDSFTFMLWGLREVVMAWKPKNLTKQRKSREESFVQLPIAVFSFVRFGELNISKSKILNQILSPEQQNQDFFVHRDIMGGNVKRKISNGLVEVAWYFPTGGESDIFNDPIAVSNLRGDLQSKRKQFHFLTSISTIVFIFIENAKDECQSTTNIEVSRENYFFIINLQPGKLIEGKLKTFLEKLSYAGNKNYLFMISKDDKDAGKNNTAYLKNMFPDLKEKILMLDPKTSLNKQIARKLQIIIREQIKTKTNLCILQEMVNNANKTGINVDENYKDCQVAKRFATEITNDIHDVATYKDKSMKLQGEVWKQISQNEKELCQMKKQGGKSGEDYKSQINKKIETLRGQQWGWRLSDEIKKFLEAFDKLSKHELQFFCKWMRLLLDSISRNSTVGQSNLGFEHFLRELSQVYEAECFMAKRRETNSKFHHLPRMAANLLLDGFPLELMDGDASNIPLQWITDVLKELDKMTGGQCKMRVISILGVQSTGKSTLLNTMFGLQFPVASGRCTRGAFMTLLKVKELYVEELGCHFILVLDTEGLKSAELSSMDECEHDNELATLVVGLGDITIVNISMENTSEMKDILQIVVHAFLRMKTIGKKPSCQFVHQNVSDVAAAEKTERERKILLNQLDEMTRVAAKMESFSEITRFSDIIQYDTKSHLYISGLWHGVPPMASISTGYSENVHELKKNLLESIKRKPKSDACRIDEFTQWIQSLWNALKHEKFLFSFRNSLVVEAYNQLNIEYSTEEWKFRREAHIWMIQTENRVKNQMPGQQLSMSDFEREITQLIQEKGKIMETFLEDYFERDDKHVKLVRNYKGDFMRSVSFLKNELRSYLNNKCAETIRIQKEKNKVKNLQHSYQTMIEKKISGLLKSPDDSGTALNNDELESMFSNIWSSTLQELNLVTVKRKEIGRLMLEHLRNEMDNKAGYVHEKLGKLYDLNKYQQGGFKMKIKHIEGPTFWVIKKRFTDEFWDEANAIALNIMDKCHRYVTNKISTNEDYSDIFCQHLLDIVNSSLKNEHVRKFDFKALFELDLKLRILGTAAPLFQQMHDNYNQENDPKLCLEKLKPTYLNMFKQIYKKKDDSKSRAQTFCEMCLKPAMIEHVFSNLGNDIVQDILDSKDSIIYGSRTFFQNALLTDLLQKNIFREYVKYCLHYEIFVKDWILLYSKERYKSGNLNTLLSNRLSAITRKVKDFLGNKSVLRHTDLRESLDTCGELLKNDLVISKTDMHVVTFQNTADVPQFFQYVQQFLGDTEKQVLNILNSFDIEAVLSKVTIKPQDELFRKVCGCGAQCPFCKVPCEAGGDAHQEHFASIHRPQGLGRYRNKLTKILCHEVCTTEVVGNATFENADTKWNPHPYKEYKDVYPNWKIQPDPSIEASLYWKYILKEYNQELAKEYTALPAEFPEDWYNITKQQALDSIKKK